MVLQMPTGSGTSAQLWTAFSEFIETRKHPETNPESGPGPVLDTPTGGSQQPVRPAPTHQTARGEASTRGRQGDPGDAGDAGDAGDSGDTGDAGDPGDPGDPGDAGGVMTSVNSAANQPARGEVSA